ncbi:hypothetical protein [Arthrobacter sp. UYCo732]|uniref:hypothetical protein n=1 Tax=Arthrobacter sp. UYCo732 TaxID=3156336 RepID=UPI0033986652
MTASKFLKTRVPRPAIASVLALLALGLAGCDNEHRLPAGDPSEYLTQGWLKTDRGYAWCLFSSVHGGSSVNCDWSTLTNEEPGKYTDITK